jgi:hypothetical protein
MSKDFYIKAVASGGGGGVPYTGATQNVDLGEYGLDAGFVNFDTTPTGTPTTQGTLSWDVDHSTLQLVLNGHVGQLMQDTFYYAKNQTGSTIPAGTVVRADGTLGASGRIKIAPFLANGTYPSKYCMGVTAESIANGADGMVMHFGQLRGIDTSAFADGDILYASSTSAGGFTTTMPTYPNNQVTVAIVIHSAVNGVLQIRQTFEQPLPIINKIKTTDGTAVTGTTANTLTDSILIPANTVAVGDVITFRNRVRKTGTAGLLSVRAYVNTTAVIGGANVAISSNANTSRFSQMVRQLAVKSSTNTESFPIAGVYTDDAQTGTVVVSSNIDWTIDQYLVISVQNTSAADSTISSFIHVQINKG